MTVKASVFVLVVALAAAAAQVATPPSNINSQAGAVASTNPPASDLELLLGQLHQTTQAMSVDLSRLRVSKWKTDGATKRQLEHNADSIAANLRSALPEMVDQARANPQNLASSFKLYRNLNVLSDVFSNLAMAAESYAPRSEAQALTGDADSLNKVVHVLGNRVESLAALKDNEIRQLQIQVAQLRAAPPPPPKKIVINDEPRHKPKKKVVEKKRVVKKKPAPKPNPTESGTGKPQ